MTPIVTPPVRRLLLVLAIILEVLAVILVKHWFGTNPKPEDALSLAFAGLAVFMACGL